MKNNIYDKGDIKVFILFLVFILCGLSVLSSKLLIPAVCSIIIVLCLYFFNILKKTDLKEKELEIEELLLLTIFFFIYSVYSLSFYIGAKSLTTLFLFIILLGCLLLLDIFKGINVFFSSKREEIHFKVDNPNSTNKILFLGDSIIMNQGVQDPKRSLEGLFMQDFPDVCITSVGMNGITTKELLELVKKEKGNHYRVAIISIGGNDIAMFRSFKKIKINLAKMLDDMAGISDQIVFIFYYDVGRAPFFSKTFLSSVFSKFFTIKSERLIEILLELKATRNFLLLNLNDPSLGESAIRKFYDTDLVHPNEEGYRRLYQQIVDLLMKKGIKL